MAHMSHIWLNIWNWWGVLFSGGPWARAHWTPLNPALIWPQNNLSLSRPVTSLGHRNQLGTPEGAMGFWEWPKFGKLCSILSNNVQHIFPGESKQFLGVASPPWLWAWVWDPWHRSGLAKRFGPRAEFATAWPLEVWILDTARFYVTYCGGQKMAPHVNKWSPLDGAHE